MKKCGDVEGLPEELNGAPNEWRERHGDDGVAADSQYSLRTPDYCSKACEMQPQSNTTIRSLCTALLLIVLRDAHKVKTLTAEAKTIACSAAS